MAGLFPENSYTEITTAGNNNTQYKGSYKFDFDKGDFVRNPDGTIAKCDDLEAYKQWCIKAMNTPVNLSSYSNLYGEEIHKLSGAYCQAAMELEVKRMSTDTLMANPRTKDVTDFVFTWQDNGKLYYEYKTVTTDGSVINLNNSAKVG